jgi:hypothetical protein
MHSVKKILMQIKQSKNFPFFCLWALYCFIYYLLPYVADDVFQRSLAAIESTENMAAFLKMYFFDLGSKLIVHALYLIALKYRAVFLIIGPLAVAWTAYLINYFFNDKQEKSTSWFICLLILIFPFWDLSTSGYVLDTIVYWLPFTLILAAFIPLKKIIEKKPVSISEYIFCLLALIYASNTEQTIILIVPILILFLILKTKECNAFVYGEIFIVFAMIIFTLFTPGNYVRLADESRVWFSDFLSLSYLKLFELGFSSTLYHYFFKPNSIFLIFYVLLFLLIWQKPKVYPKIAVIFLGAVVLFCGYFTDFARNAITVYGYIDPYFPSPEKIFILILLIITFIALLYSIIRAFDGSFLKNKKRLQCLFILFLGFASRMLLALSPSIWGSQTRTYCYLNFAILISSIILLSELKKTKFTKYKELYIFTIFLAALCLIFLLLQIVNGGGGGGIPNLSEGQSFVNNYLIPKYDIKGWEMAVISISRG